MCKEFQYDADICANLSSHPEEQVSVQQVVSTINMYTELVTNIPAVFFVLFLGSWSDKYGRKIPMTLPLIGSFLATLLYLVSFVNRIAGLSERIGIPALLSACRVGVRDPISAN